MVIPYLFIVGTAVGSFLNVLIDRLPNEESILGRSHCDYCKKQLPWFVNIPIFSYLFLLGKTSCCKRKLSIQYPFIELLTGVMFVVIWIWLPSTGTQGNLNFKFSILNQFQILNFEKVVYLGLFSTLLVVFVADLKYHIIPDSMQVALLVCAVLLQILATGHAPSLADALNGVIIMAPILFLFLATLGRGMGFGDVKLAFTMGYLLGWKGGVIALYIAFVSGAIVGIVLLFLKKRGMKSKIAFGPFLVIGLIVSLLFQLEIMRFVTHFFTL